MGGGRGKGRGGELPYKDDGGARREFSKNVLKITRILFYGRGLIEINSLEVPTLNHYMSYSVSFFLLSTLKGTAVILIMVILDPSTLSGPNLQIETPKR